MIIPVILFGATNNPADPSITASRVENKAFFSAPIVIGSQSDAEFLEHGLRNHLPACTVLEPFGRQTAAAIAIAALLAFEIEPQTPMLVLPSDQEIRNIDAFLQAVHLATPLVEEGYIVTFGIKPTEPDNHYGYIEKGAEIPDHEFAKKIKSFVEKPDIEKAKSMLATGNFFWNSGIVMATAETLIEEFTRFSLDVLNACRDTLAHSPEQENIIRLSPTLFDKVPHMAFDVAILEKTQKAVVLQSAFEWSDFGGEINPQQQGNNSVLGKAIKLDADVQNVSVTNETTMSVKISGVSDIQVIVTENGIVITPNKKI